MTCSQARDALLEAELAELLGEGPSDLAAHVRTCPECAACAGAILGSTRALDGALAALTATAPLKRSAGRPSLRRFLPLGLAAAAAIAALLLARRSSISPPPAPRAAVSLPRGIEVDLSASKRDVAVFQTADSTITVVWYF